MLTRVRLLSLATIAVLLLSSCALLPSDPVPAPIGLRMDGGVISFILPTCATNLPISVEVAPAPQGTFSPPVWTASGFLGKPRSPISLSSADWSSIRGDYSKLTKFSISVHLDRVDWSTIFDRPHGLADLQNLPPDVYWVGNDVVRTATQYFADNDADFPCPSPRASS